MPSNVHENVNIKYCCMLSFVLILCVHWFFLHYSLMKTIILTLCLIRNVDGSFIIFHPLWQKFWACNTICVAM